MAKVERKYHGKPIQQYVTIKLQYCRNRVNAHQNKGNLKEEKRRDRNNNCLSSYCEF